MIQVFFSFILVITTPVPESRATSLQTVDTLADEDLVGVLDLSAVDDGYAVLLDHPPFVRIYQGETRKAFVLKGQGPGDLNDPIALCVDGDRILVLNRNPCKLVIYNLEGDLLESHRIRQYMLNYDIAATNGTILLESSQFPDLTKSVYVLGSEEHVIVDLPEISSVKLTAKDGMTLSTPLPFFPSPKWTLWKSGKIVLWDGASKHLIIKDIVGKEVGRMALDHKPVQISRADRQHWIDRAFPEGKTVFGRKDFYKGLRSVAEKDLDFPSHAPLVQKLETGDDGRIWVLRFSGAAGQQWIGLKVEEDPLVLSFGKGRQVRHFGETSCAAVATTDDGDEIIEVYAYK